jgi:thiol-disulfide isomerase/thioredoxin
VLEAATGETAARRYDGLWTLEFKARPSSEHEALRAQVRADIAHIKRMGDGAAMALAVIKGYELTGDTEGRDAARRDLLARFPCEAESVRLRVSEWDEAHPRPAFSAEETVRRTYEQARYEHQAAIASTCPANAMVASSRARAARTLGDLPAKEVEAVLDDFLAARAASPTLIAPLAIADHVVELAVSYRLRLEVVPELIRTWRDGPKLRAPSADAPESQREAYDRMRRQAEFDQAWLQARADNLTGCRPEAEAALPRLEGWLENAGYERSRMEAQIAWLRAEMAEEAGTLADALVFYQAAAAGLRSDALFRRSSQQALQRLGASESALAALSAPRRTVTYTTPPPGGTRTLVSTSGSSAAWKEIDKKLPAASLERLGGGRWIVQEDVKGKRTFLNVWATWCEPCQKELPELQRLQERIKGRADLAVVSLNVDDNPGVVAPFMKEKGYTFPVLFAGAFWESLKVEQSIPLNWIVDGEGVARSEHRGFGAARGDAWLDAALAALEGKSEAKAPAAN